MSPAWRRILLVPGTAGLLALLVWASLGLHPLGHYPGPYGDEIARRVVPERHVTDAVSAVNFDYRGFDTLGEEFIFFASVAGAALLLRPHRGERHEEQPERTDQGRERAEPPLNEAVRLFALGLAGPTVVFGIYIITHGQLTPGGGFQGGVILATVPLLVYLAGDLAVFRRITPHRLVEAGEAAGAGGFALVGLLGLLAAGSFLRNALPSGEVGDPFSGGTMPVISALTGLEIAGGFVLLLAAFLAKTVGRRLERQP